MNLAIRTFFCLSACAASVFGAEFHVAVMRELIANASTRRGAANTPPGLRSPKFWPLEGMNRF